MNQNRPRTNEIDSANGYYGGMQEQQAYYQQQQQQVVQQQVVQQQQQQVAKQHKPMSKVVSILLNLQFQRWCISNDEFRFLILQFFTKKGNNKTHIGLSQENN